MSETLRGIEEEWRHVAAMRNLNFEAKLDEEQAYVMGDEMVLRRLIGILLDNAFKYTPSPGSVRLSLECRGENLMIKVQDSGVGIAQGEQNKIFERFYRVDKTRSRAQGGAGLGLAIAQWIATQHRGTIHVESQPSLGSTFVVDLPTIATPVHTPQVA